MGHDCVILENHGVVTAGESLQQAFWRLETFEFTGKTIIKSASPPMKFVTSRMRKSNLGAWPRTVPSCERTAPTNDEKELRVRICDFVHRAYRLRLFISTKGSFSARLDRDSFVITPSQVDRERLAVEDLSLVCSGRANAGSTPSRAAGLHDAIYRRHPHVEAIINAYP